MAMSVSSSSDEESEVMESEDEVDETAPLGEATIPLPDEKDSTKRVSIVAPMSLPQGYKFDATIDHRTIQVVVPKGGVQEGDVLHIPLKSFASDDERPSVTPDVVKAGSAAMTDDSNYMSATERILKKNRELKQQRSKSKVLGKNLTSTQKVNFVPDGIWRYGLCSCSDVVCSNLFWMSLFFPWILVGQLLQRLKLNFWGCRDDNYKNTCALVSVFMLSTILIEVTLTYLAFITESAVFLNLAAGVFLYTLLLLLYWSYILRSTLRQGFGLPTTVCRCGCDDCLISLFCNCCSSIQIARHTHNEAIHRYQACSSTGLPISAPPVSYI